MIMFQFFIVLFFIFAIVKVFQRHRTKEITLRGLIFWVLFWAMAGVVVVLPNTTLYFARLAGIGRGVDLIMYVALAGLFYALFRLTIKVEVLNRNITELTRKIALKEKK